MQAGRTYGKIFCSAPATVLFLLAFLFTPLLPLDPDRKVTQYMIDSWDQKDGLPQNTVTAIIQTRDGYIWIGTQEGMARFNGRRFAHFTKDKYPEIVNDYIISMIEDKNGTLWAGSRKGLLEYRQGRFIRHSTESGLDRDFVRSLAEDSGGTLWVGTESGLYRRENRKFYKYEKLGDERINSIQNDPYNHKIFVGTNNGLYFIRNMNLENVSLGRSLTASIVRDIRVISGNEMLVATMGAGIAWLKDGGMNFLTTRNGLSSDNIYRIITDRDGNIWACCDETGGVNRINRGGIHSLGESDDLLSDSLNSIAEDNEGNLWIGGARGLMKLMDGKVIMVSVKEGLVSNYVNPVTEWNGKIFAGTNRGVNVIKDGRASVHRGNTFNNQKIFSFSPDGRGGFWTGTFDRGAFYESGSRIDNYTMKDGLPSDTVFSIITGSSGEMWFGTMGGLAVFRDGKFRVYGKDDGLSHLIVYYLMKDRAGNLWIGTGGGGVDVFRDGRFRNYSTDNGLSDNFIMCIYEDRDGYIWVGTTRGLNVIRDGRISTIDTGDGLYNNVTFTIIEDDGGLFWMSSNKGIYTAKRSDLLEFIDGRRDRIECGVFTEADGMANSECSGGFSPPGWRTESGDILISSVGGMVVIDPENIRKNNSVPPVVIEEAAVDGEIKFLNDDRIILDPGSDKLEIRFSVLSYTTIQRNRVGFILEGYEKDWTVLDSTREWAAHYTNLPPGKYTFRVKGANGDGVWNEAGASLLIRIRPFFWETGWFRVMALLFFSFLSYMIISLLRKYIRVFAFWKEKNYIGHYRLIDKIGSGGMGTVYRARDILKKGSMYAVKILREELFDDREQLSRLKNEAIIIDRLSHKNIVRIIERGEYHGGIYIVMEFLSGRTLSVLAGASERPEIDEVREIMVQICDALLFIHGKNIIHRDLKPDNVIVERDEKGEPVVKLLDFGLARIDTFTKLTQTGAVMGSIHYLSPEQLTGGKVTDKSDVFQAGIIFYELLTGGKPFTGETAVEVMQSILGKEPDFSNRVFREIPPQMLVVLKQMLSKSPDERPPAARISEILSKN